MLLGFHQGDINELFQRFMQHAGWEDASWELLEKTNKCKIKMKICKWGIIGANIWPILEEKVILHISNASRCAPPRGAGGASEFQGALSTMQRLHWPFHDLDAFSTMTGGIFLYSSHVYNRQLWISIRSLCHLPQSNLTDKAHAKVNYITCTHNINPDPSVLPFC